MALNTLLNNPGAVEGYFGAIITKDGATNVPYITLSAGLYLLIALSKQIKGAGNLNGVADNALRPNKNIVYFIFALLTLYTAAALAAGNANAYTPLIMRDWPGV